MRSLFNWGEPKYLKLMFVLHSMSESSLTWTFIFYLKDSFTSIIFLTLPRVVLGNSSQNTTSLGHL